MNFKEILESIKDTIKEKWKMIAIGCGVIFLTAIMLGLFWPKQHKESVLKKRLKETNINEIYLDVIKNDPIESNLMKPKPKKDKTIIETKEKPDQNKDDSFFNPHKYKNRKNVK